MQLSKIVTDLFLVCRIWFLKQIVWLLLSIWMTSCVVWQSPTDPAKKSAVSITFYPHNAGSSFCEYWNKSTEQHDITFCKRIILLFPVGQEISWVISVLEKWQTQECLLNVPWIRAFPYLMLSFNDPTSIFKVLNFVHLNFSSVGLLVYYCQWVERWIVTRSQSEFLQQARDFSPLKDIQTGSEVHTASYAEVNGVSPIGCIVAWAISWPFTSIQW
jgi:branched-subunit amino acid transport protein AzlD